MEATVLVAPAEIHAQPDAPPSRRRRAVVADVEPEPPEPEPEPEPEPLRTLVPPEPPSERPAGPRGELADVARLLREGQHTLAAARVDGPPRD